MAWAWAVLLCEGLSLGSVGVRPTPEARSWRVALPVRMLARKPFKGGRLDDFVAAGEAEAKFGPQRYAAVAQDAWKISVEQKERDMSRAKSAEVGQLPKS